MQFTLYRVHSDKCASSDINITCPRVLERNIQIVKKEVANPRWPCCLGRRFAAARFKGSRVGIPLGAWLFATFVRCVV